MKVLHINCNYTDSRLHRTMMRELDRQGVDNTVFCPLPFQSKSKAAPEGKNEFIVPCFQKWDRLLYFYKQSRIKRALRKSVKNLESFDCFHAYTLMSDGNVAYSLSQATGKPFFVAVRDTDVNYFFKYRPYLLPRAIRILKGAKTVYFLSESYRKITLEKYVPAKIRDEIARKSRVVPNGIDDFWLGSLFESRNISAAEERIQKKELSVLCVGKVNRRKNIPAVQQALSVLRSRGWTVSLKVIGAAENKYEMQRVFSDPHTVYLPPMKKEGLIEEYRKADIFVLASHSETFGLVYAEAMSQAMPVIYTRGQGFDGQFPEGEVGCSVNDTDPENIADGIERACADYGRLARNAVKNAAAFNWHSICRQYLESYHEIKQ